MPTLPVGTIALLVVTVLVYFGLAQRLLDRMRLNDRTTLLIIGAMVRTYLPHPVSPCPVASGGRSRRAALWPGSTMRSGRCGFFAAGLQWPGLCCVHLSADEP